MTAWIGLLTAVLAASASGAGKRDANAAPSIAAPSAVASSSASCLGQPVAEMRGTSAENRISELDKVDVNGRPISHHSIVVSGEISGISGGYVVAFIEFDRNQLVTSVEVGIPHPITGKETTSEYDSTGV